MLNPPPVQAAADTQIKGGLKLSEIWRMWYGLLYQLVLKVVDYSSMTVQVPVTGFSITFADRAFVLTLNPAGTLATGTIVLSANPLDGQVAEVSSTQTITGLTVSPNAGQTVNNAPTTLSAGTGFAFYYNAASLTWFRRY